MAKSYKKRADGRYQKVVRLKGSDGIEIRKTVYGRTLGELEARIDQVKEDYKKGVHNNPGVTLGEYALDWLETIRNNRAENTYKFYELSVKHILETIGAIRLQDLNKAHIQKALDSFRGQTRTQHIFRMTIGQICENAVDDKTIPLNPCRKIKLPKYEAQEKRALTAIELDAIRTADLDEKERLFVSLLFYCGLRRGEALALSRADIDLKNNLITVNHSLAFPDNAGILKEPKTAAGRRSLYIPPELREQLVSYKYDMYLFTTQNGDLFSRSAYRKLWTRIIRKLNEAAGGGSINKISGLSAHLFRHHFATMLHDHGVDIKEAQRLLGHESYDVTANIYVHLDEITNETKQKIENAFTLRRA